MTNRGSYELCVFPHDRKPNLQALEVMPTVCLLALRTALPATDLDELIKGCLAVGVILFATYGDAANAVEEQIDCILETGQDNWSDVATTSHQGDSIDDLVHFLTKAAYCENEHFRCLVIIDKSILEGDRLLHEFEAGATKVEQCCGLICLDTSIGGKYIN